MKTPQNIRDEISSLEKTGAMVHDQTEKNRIRKRLAMIRPLLRYLETVDVTEKMIDRNLRDTLKKIERIEKEFELEFPTYVTSKVKSDWMKAKRIPELKKQLKSLQYLMEKH